MASPNWSSGSGSTVGAATWGNGATGSIGTVSTANSLVGAFNSNDQVSSDGITALTNGNYVVGSSNWNTGRGAATWGNGATGSNGTVSVANSLVGISPNTQVLTGDRVSSDGITALTNGNYVVGSSNWNTGRGAATWSNGATGSIGAVSATNSLIGFTAATTFNNFFGDFVSSGGVTALSNGNYVVKSSIWNNGTITRAGATTWGNGLTGINGIVSTINSLTGSATRDFDDGEVASVRITGLSNGNYAVSSDIWDNGSLIDAGQVRIATPQNIFFNNGLGQTMTFNPSTIATTLALGTSITLQASNDLTLDVGTDIIVGGSNGGALTMQAGRNLTLNSSIFTANGNFTAIAGDPNAIAADRGVGTPTITLGSSASINAGAGQVVLAAIGGNFVNNTGSTAPITAAQWLVYSTDPRLNSRNGMVADFKHYGQDYTGITPSYASSGNWFFYSMTPVLTVTPNSQTITYGGTPANFTFTLTGFIDGDTIDTAGINGLAGFGIDNFTGAIGRYNVAYLKGLASSLGYVFIDNTVSIDELTVIPAVETPVVLFNPNFLSQISALQQSVLFLPWEHQKLANGEDDFVDIKDKGIKLPNFDDPFNIHCEDPAGYLGGASRNWMLASPASMTAFVNLGTLFNWIDVQ
ncbi:MAG: MBG domain-containing protein [Methylococcales bacterium]|nr:MBG domain-containing protein [Methylococcales bacterium]